MAGAVAVVGAAVSGASVGGSVASGGCVSVASVARGVRVGRGVRSGVSTGCSRVVGPPVACPVGALLGPGDMVARAVRGVALGDRPPRTPPSTMAPPATAAMTMRPGPAATRPRPAPFFAAIAGRGAPATVPTAGSRPHYRTARRTSCPPG